ncbi:MAG: hypothetical protein KF708_16680 [Pirellulales bacterium]|nr:hypothetical protein [Pirellulales bacterium]
MSEQEPETKPDAKYEPMSYQFMLRIVIFFLVLVLIPWVLVKIVDLLF